MTDDPASLYLARVETLVAADPRLTPLAAGILAAVEFGIASDSIAFSKALGVSHALVLREVDALEHDLGLLKITSRNPRNRRTLYELSVAFFRTESTNTLE